MKRHIWTIVVLLVSAYFIYSYLENRAKREDEKVEAEMIEKVTKAAVTQLVERTNAVHNWEKELSKGEGFRLEPILTLELERLWLTDRPILFVGSIKDISTIDHENYRIKIERGMLTSIEYEYMFWTELQLALQCPKQMVDSFLSLLPIEWVKYHKSGKNRLNFSV